MKHWLKAIRPKTLTASLAPIIVGASFALAAGHFNGRILTMILIATLSIQIATNLVNDYFDYLKGIDDHMRVGSTKVLVEGVVSVHAMRKAIMMVFTVSILSSTYLILKGGWPIALVALSSMVFAVIYTAGPFPLGHIGLADPIEFIYFGPVAVSGTYYLLTHSLAPYVVVGGLIPGFLSLAILAVDNLRDYDTDGAKGKKTLCVRFGKSFAQIEYYICILCGMLTPIALIAMTGKHLLSLSCFIILPLYKTCLDAVKENKDAETLNKALSQTAACLLLFTLIFSAGWLL